MGCKLSSIEPIQILPKEHNDAKSVAPILKRHVKGSIFPLPSELNHIKDNTGLLYREPNSLLLQCNIIAAVKSGQIELVKKSLLRGEDINMKGMWSNTALILALQLGYEDISLYLLNQPQIDVNHLNDKKACALVLACMIKSVPIVTKLLELGVNYISTPTALIPFTGKDLLGFYSPLSVTCMTGSIEILQILLSLGSCPNMVFNFLVSIPQVGELTKTITGLSPLSVTCAYGNFKCVELLLKVGASVATCDSEGNTCLHRATFLDPIIALEAVCLFQRFSFLTLDLIQTRNKTGYTVMGLATLYGLETVCAILLEDDNLCSTIVNEFQGIYEDICTCLHIAVGNEMIKIVQLFVNKQANCSLTDGKGRLPEEITSNPIIIAILQSARKDILTKASDTKEKLGIQQTLQKDTDLELLSLE